MLTKIIADQFFKRLDTIEFGTLKLTTPDGKTRVFQGVNNGETAHLHLHDWSVIRNLISKGDIGFAEDYRDGKWDTDDLIALNTLGLANRKALDNLVGNNYLSRLMAIMSYTLRNNTVRGSKKNIQAHYDLGNDFYELWLDDTMTYSSAIYNDPKETLEHAQNNKYDRMINGLNKTSGSLLEIGCGWGGFADRAMTKGDFGIKGITLSNEQAAYARQRLNNKANIALEDYRHQTGTFDNIVSIEMFEAVGEKFWSTYFSTVKKLLSKNGTAMIQTITMNDDDFPVYRRSGDFIRSYIFPGGMLPSPSRFEEEVAKAGLRTNDTFSFGQDYATTLTRWLNTFDTKIDEVKTLGFDDKFIRLWRFYLAGCVAGFRTQMTDVMQVQLTHA